MDASDNMLTDFKELIYEAIKLIDSVLYSQQIDSCSDLQTLLS